MKVRIDVTGDREMRASLKALGGAGVTVAKKVFEDVTVEVVRMAKPLTPVEPEDGGQLRDSVRKTKPMVTRAGRVSAGVVAGGAPLKPFLGSRRANVYAVVQHEDLTLKHKTGQAKFIEIPMMRKAPTVPGRLLAELDREAARATR